MIWSFNPTCIYSNDRNVHDAMFTLPNKSGTIEEIIKIYDGFKPIKVAPPFRGWELKVWSYVKIRSIQL